VRYWDTSALVPLVVEEAASEWARAQAGEDPRVIVWWATRLECLSGLARLEREGVIAPDVMAAAVRRLDELEARWETVEPTPPVRAQAERILRTHALRTGDALQLAAALTAAGATASSLPFVTRDARLALAAEREGFPVVAPD
jgi:predicted nucleic acid-binding protein